MLPDLEAVPTGLVLDGELIAFDDGRPSFPLLCNQVLHRNSEASVTFVAFDVLYPDGGDTMPLPLAERRAVLKSLPLESPAYIGPTFGDGRRSSTRSAATATRASSPSGYATRTSPVSGPG